MPLYDHCMVDIETTGLSRDHSAMIQLTAVSFCMRTRQVDHNFFNQCLMVPTTRFWDDSTRNWWLTMPDTLGSIFSRMRDPAVVMQEFYDWCDGPQCSMHFWAKPLSFDYPFVESYFREFGPVMCFDHRKGRDLRTFLTGLNFPHPPLDDREVEFEGEQHNALFDTLHQIKILFRGLDGARGLRMEILA